MYKRQSGYKALHDEASAYLREVAAAKAAPVSKRRWVSDWYAFTLSFKGVLLEGLEVVFIVITFGANQHNLGAAVIGAAAAVVVVAAIVVAALAVTALLTHVAGVNAWWLLPLCAFAALAWSLYRATARKD